MLVHAARSCGQFENDADFGNKGRLRRQKSFSVLHLSEGSV